MQLNATKVCFYYIKALIGQQLVANAQIKHCF